GALRELVLGRLRHDATRVCARARGRPAHHRLRQGPSVSERSARLRARLEGWLVGWRGFLIVYLVFAGAYLGPAGGRRLQHPIDNHYVYLAEGWLHGRLALAGQPPNENDWAKVDVFKLRDGRELRGVYGSKTGGPVDRFYPLRGPSETVPESEIV